MEFRKLNDSPFDIDYIEPTKEDRDAYGMGYQTAYAKTSWGLSGKTFNAYEEAYKEAYEYKLLDNDARRFIKGFMDYCATHSGTWTAII